MKASILITNYNYGRFVIECVNSALNQTHKNIEIIIIDDGSTDNSLELLYDNYNENTKIKIVSKENGGQLSAFNEAKKHVSGNIIFFLDSDDIYRKNYVEEILNVYENNKEVDFVFCAYERFFSNGKKELVRKYKEDTDLGFSVLSAIYTKEWLGSVTSTVSMRWEVFDKILPIPLEADWITRADDCLIRGSSIVGAKKYYCHKPLVLYRVHGENHFYGKYISKDNLYRRELATNKLLLFFVNTFGISEFIVSLISLEFKSRNPKNLKLLIQYLKIIIYTKETFLIKIRRMISLIKIYGQHCRGVPPSQ